MGSGSLRVCSQLRRLSSNRKTATQTPRTWPRRRPPSCGARGHARCLPGHTSWPAGRAPGTLRSGQGKQPRPQPDSPGLPVPREARLEDGFLGTLLLGWALSVQRAAVTCRTGLWCQYEPGIVRLGTYDALGRLFIYKSTQCSPWPLHSALSQNAHWLLPVSQTGLPELIKIIPNGLFYLPHTESPLHPHLLERGRRLHTASRGLAQGWALKRRPGHVKGSTGAGGEKVLDSEAFWLCGLNLSKHHSVCAHVCSMGVRTVPSSLGSLAD